MSRRSLITGLLLFVAGLAGFAVGRAQETVPGGAPAGGLQTLEDKASYAIGLDLGKNIVADESGLNADLIVKGLMDAVKKNKPLLTEEQMREVMTAYSRQRQAATAPSSSPLQRRTSRRDRSS
jgi:hypothetical protein